MQFSKTTVCNSRSELSYGSYEDGLHRDSKVDIVTKLRTGRQRNGGSMPGTGTTILSTLTHPKRL